MVMKASGGSEPVKVLFVASGFELPGGISNLSGSVLRALDDLVAQGSLSRVDVVSLHDRRAPLRPPGSGRSLVARGGKARLVASVLRLVASSRPDLALFDHIRPARAIRVVPRQVRPPYGVMVHGLELQEPVRASTRAVLTRAAIILANSKHTAERAVGLVGPQIAARTEVVSPCISRERAEAWSAAETSRKRRHQVVIVGRLEAGQPGKGHEALIEAWPRIVAVMPSARLVIAGDGNKRSTLERLVEEQGLGDNVEFYGHVSRERLGELYRQSAVYAMPSRQEGFGIVFVEAMWHGLPCIGSKADAAGEVILDGETGILVPYGDTDATVDALMKLLTDDHLATAMGQAGRERCLELFTPDAFQGRLLSTVGRVVGT